MGALECARPSRFPVGHHFVLPKESLALRAKEAVSLEVSLKPSGSALTSDL